MSAMVHIRFVVLGEPAAKANQRRLVMFGKRPALIKSKKALSYVDSFRMQCPKLSSPLEDDVAMWCRIWYASRRPDLDESLIMDAMQGLVIVNDRQIREKHTFWDLDKHNPRADICITRMGLSNPF